MKTQLVAREGTGLGHKRHKDLLDITVLMGGPSSERQVSLVSGEAVAGALERLGHRVQRADISPADTAALERENIDVVFIALHGQFGESGEVQELCERRRLRYTGSGPQASRLAMDKSASKELFRSAGLATPDWLIVTKGQDLKAIRPQLKALGLPAVLKPVNGGSSVDITIARDEGTRDEALEGLLEKYPRAMVERFIKGRELTVGILGSRALPIIEIVPAREFYDYTAKYADDAGTQYLPDHGLPEALVQRVQQEALTAHNGLRCRDMSRVDFILDDSNVPWVLEINTIPGFTGHSLLPMAAAKAGVGFDMLVGGIAAMSLAR